MKITNPDLMEDVLKLRLFLDNAYYDERAPMLKAKVRRTLNNPEADEVDLRECVQRIEDLIAVYQSNENAKAPEMTPYLTAGQWRKLWGDISDSTFGRKKRGLEAEQDPANKYRWRFPVAKIQNAGLPLPKK